ncbi:hypothetical protein DFH09DRAFT_1409210 [Mycena vulgaris]|nr:hypothetical protein DFH09DRAFT_1409210 [Mycena vulgaris]
MSISILLNSTFSIAGKHELELIEFPQHFHHGFFSICCTSAANSPKILNSITSICLSQSPPASKTYATLAVHRSYIHWNFTRIASSPPRARSRIYVPLDWLLQYLLAADGFLIQSHTINFMFMFHLPQLQASTRTRTQINSLGNVQRIGPIRTFLTSLSPTTLESLRHVTKTIKLYITSVIRLGGALPRVTFGLEGMYVPALTLTKDFPAFVAIPQVLEAAIHDVPRLSGPALSLAVIPPPAQLLIKLPLQLPPRPPPPTPLPGMKKYIFLRLRLRISGSESQAPRLRLPRVDSSQVNLKFTPFIRILAMICRLELGLRLKLKTQSRLGLETRTRSARRLSSSVQAQHNPCASFPLFAFSFLARVHFQELVRFGIGIGIHSFARARRGARARRRRCALGPQALKPSLTQDSAPRKYTFIFAPRTTRLELRWDSDTRTEGKGKSVGALGMGMHRYVKYMDGPNANAKGNASPGCKNKRQSRRRMRRCHDDVRGGRVRALRGSQWEHATAIPPSRPLRRTTAASAPRRHATPAQHEGRREEGRNESQGARREKEGNEAGKTTHRVLPIAIPAGPALIAPGGAASSWTVRAVVDAGEDGTGEGDLCLGGGLGGVERGEGCVRVVGVCVGGGRGRPRRRRAAVVLREAIGHGQPHRRPEDDSERDEREGACGDEEEGAWAEEKRAAVVLLVGGDEEWPMVLGRSVRAMEVSMGRGRAGGVGVGGGRCWRRRGIPIRIIAAADHPRREY